MPITPTIVQGVVVPSSPSAIAAMTIPNAVKPALLPGGSPAAIAAMVKPLPAIGTKIFTFASSTAIEPKLLIGQVYPLKA